MATIVKNGESFTSVAGDTELYLDNPPGNNTDMFGATVIIELVSGSVQFSVGGAVQGSHRTYSTAGDKTIRTVSNSGNNSLHCKGIGVFTIGW